MSLVDIDNSLNREVDYIITRSGIICKYKKETLAFFVFMMALIAYYLDIGGKTVAKQNLLHLKITLDNLSG